MSSRRSARASAGKRLSYREESDAEDAADLTQDEYHQERASTSADDEPLERDQSDENSDADQRSRRPAKRRKQAPTPTKRTTPTTSASGHDWEPGVSRVVIKLVGPPQSGHVARGELSPNVFKFLSDLHANNEREWFAQHDAVYRYCWKNFGEFTDAVLNDIMEQVDDTVPWLPTKDLVYRIYRDVRFSNDKTPYKTNLMASFSRGGRKGPFAGYHVLIKPNGRSFFAAGRWQPEKQDLAIIRQHILDNTHQAKALKAAVNDPDFVKWFGPPKRDASATKAKAKARPKTQHSQQRCNLWGGDDELKVAPKIPGVDKTHKDIDWLKLRSFCVIHNFPDSEVLRKDFRKRLVEAAKASEPLVRILNSMTSPDPPPPPGSDDEEEEDSRQGDHVSEGEAREQDDDDDDDEEEELVPAESFDYVSDDDSNNDDSEDEDEE
ncbi:uncharacterized protein UTRI_05094_B [Ustilago trichophora]|uniref:DUF2461 domain-containing protein n=1 Tax=Ustilago trichophora TaxID=86804 RepID=A0A5C3EDV3_9BASI|nr:uncharacterized protein UTRI_05094_B [Ustilago trichophora]